SQATPAPLGADDWVTLAHDAERTGLEQGYTGITLSNVNRLQPAWTQTVDANCDPATTVNLLVISASPIVANGFVYVATDCGNVYSLNAVDGTVAWGPVRVGDNIQATPTLADGTLFVPAYGSHPPETGSQGPPTGARLVALDAASGKSRWAAPIPGNYGNLRGEPLVMDGVVYQGVAGGDYGSAVQKVFGGIVGFDENSGGLLGRWQTITASGCGGGGSWSPISTDGSALYFGTGNTGPNTGASDACGYVPPPVAGYEDSVVSLPIGTSFPGTPAWAFRAYDASHLDLDDDVGGGTLVWNGALYFAGKSGLLYSLTPQGHPNPTFNGGLPVPLDALSPGYGGVGTPTTDSTVIAITSGYSQRLPSGGLGPGEIEVFDLQGTLLYKFQMTQIFQGAVAFIPTIGFLPQDQSLIGFQASTGAVLWRAPLANLTYASPAIVPSGLYEADSAGNIYAFRMPPSGPTAQSRAAGPTHLRPVRKIAPLHYEWRRN
ncbi:MAG: PQQ-binding-like beta-propeller repeat protein, partial [Vulcanimicrobiaceae bacterium]